MAQAQSILMILKLLLNKTFVLKNTIQIKNKILIVMWLLICLVIKKLNQIATGLFIRGGKLNISLAFITQSYYAVPKNI